MDFIMEFRGLDLVMGVRRLDFLKLVMVVRSMRVQ